MFGASFQMGWTSNIMNFRTNINVLDVFNVINISLGVREILEGVLASFYPLGGLFGAIFSGFLANGAGR